MALHPRPQVVNPLLGTFFGIFAACLVAIVVTMLILEQLGASDAALRRLMLVGPLTLFLVIGAIGYAATPREFLLAGRRVPAALSGLAIAIAAIGGTGLTALSGALFLIGFDALCLALGIIAGLVAMVILIAPFFRKFGAATLPGFLGARFESAGVRLIAAGAAAVPLLLLMMAEIKVATAAVVWLTQGSEAFAAGLVTLALVVILVPGGVRSLSWSSAAQSLAALLAFLIPLAVAAVIVTNLPLGQVSHGPVLRMIGRIEAAQAVATPVAGALLLELPGQALQPIAGRFATPFGSIGAAAFVLTVLAVMAGIAASPGLLARTGTSPTVYETRKSLGWAVVVAGVVIMSMSALAVFLRESLMTDLVGQPPERWPAALKQLIDLGLMGIDGQARAGGAQSFLYRRDGVLLTLPILLEFPAVMVHLAVAGVVAAALAAAASSLTQLGLIVAEDVIGGPRPEPQSPGMRLMIVRGSLAAVAVFAGTLAHLLPGDPLDLMLSSLAVSGAALFPVMVLAIWWKRTNAWGAMAGMLTGFAIAMAGVLAVAVEVIALAPILLAVLAALISTAVAILVTRVTPAPSRHILEMVRDLRIPGGEAVEDREARLAAQRERQGRTG